MKTTAKSLSVIRIAKLKSPAGRDVLERVTAEGKLSKRAAKKFGVRKAASWLEVTAQTWKAATKLVKAGKGRKVAAATKRVTDWDGATITKQSKGGAE